LRRWFILQWSRSLSEFLATSRPSDPSVGPTSLRFFSLQRCPSGEPHIGRVVQPPSWFRSRAFPTPQRFRSKPELRGLVSCRNRSWDSPFRAFPSLGIAHPSRSALASLQLSTSVLKRTARFSSAPASPTPTLSRSCLVPPDAYGSPFHAPKRASRSPRAPNSRTVPFRQLHLLRSLDPPASPFAPARVTPNRRPLLSWVSPL